MRAKTAPRGCRPESNSHKVAIVGAGPAGLTCAGDLARMGYEVTVFEALHTAGGVLICTVFRVPSAELSCRRIDAGISVLSFISELRCRRSETIDELFGDSYEAIFVGSGAGHRPLSMFGRERKRRLLRKRIPDPHQSDEAYKGKRRHPDLPREEGQLLSAAAAPWTPLAALKAHGRRGSLHEIPPGSRRASARLEEVTT